MNYARLASAAVVGTIVDGLYGFVVYGILLSGQFADFPGVYRSRETASAYMPYLFLGILVAMIAAAYIYAKGYEGGSGVVEGARFGAAVGVFAVGYDVIVNFATLNVGRRLAASVAIAAFVEWIIDGAVIGAVYKPAPGATRRAAAV